MRDELKQAFRYYRGRGYPDAATALKWARRDVADGKRRYASSPWTCGPAVTWQPRDKRTSERFAHVEPGALGLRFTGRVTPESYGGRDTWDSRGGCGWHTDPFGDVFKDGTGLCYGVVYQLPARDGRARFVAGYEFGGMDGGPTLDFGNVYESEDCRGDYGFSGGLAEDTAREAARMADEHARVAAEREREYETAWQAGRHWADLGEEIADARREALADLATRRAIRADLSRVGVPLESREWQRACAMIRERVESALADIQAKRAERAKLRAGDMDSLMFYPNPDLVAAFEEGAGV